MILFVLAKQIVIIELYRNHHTNWNISTARASEQGKCNQKNKGESRVSRTDTGRIQNRGLRIQNKPIFQAGKRSVFYACSRHRCLHNGKLSEKKLLTEGGIYLFIYLFIYKHYLYRSPSSA